ncbi:MAG: DUF86 domain-containing protein [Eggerthellaceae bacterium]|nr:DUF86 domain-containing protein [Eggerthellaceae bacterium]
MNAKNSDLGRIQEIYDVITQTKRQIKALNITKERFLDPPDDADDLIAEGVMNRVLRATEEAGRLSDEAAENYGFDRRGVLGVRNRLAHAYGDVDREVIWLVIERDFDALLESCKKYCDDKGFDLE